MDTQTETPQPVETQAEIPNNRYQVFGSVFSMVLVAVFIILAATDVIHLDFFNSKASGPDAVLLYGQDLQIPASANLDDPGTQRDILRDVKKGYDKPWDLDQLEISGNPIDAIPPDRGILYFNQVIPGPSSGKKARVEGGFVSLIIGEAGASEDIIADGYITGVVPQDPQISEEQAISAIIPPLDSKSGTPELVYHRAFPTTEFTPAPEPYISTLPTTSPMSNIKDSSLLAAIIAEDPAADTSAPADTTVPTDTSTTTQSSDVPATDSTIPADTTPVESSPTPVPEPAATDSPGIIETIIQFFTGGDSSSDAPSPDSGPSEPTSPTESTLDGPGAPGGPSISPTPTPSATFSLPPVKWERPSFGPEYRLAYRIPIINAIEPFIPTTGGGGRGRTKGLSYSPEPYCSQDTDCASGLLCISGLCKVPRLENEFCDAVKASHDCSSGLTCNSVSNSCKTPTVLDACMRDSDCTSGDLKTSNRFCGSDRYCHVKESLSPQIVFGTGNGLSGDYGCLGGIPPAPFYHKFYRLDSQVNFNWGTASPVDSYCPQNNKNLFSVNWEGKLEVPQAGTYTIYLNVTPNDDNGCFTLSGQTCAVKSTGEAKKTLTLEQKLYDFSASVTDVSGNAKVQLYWTGPGIPTKTLIPQKHLYTYDALPPEITTQPKSLTVLESLPATFTISVTGTCCMSYEWYHVVNGTPTKITGATGPTYTIPTTSQSDAGTYYAIATNGFGSVGSEYVTLTVQALPSSGENGLRGYYYGNTTLDPEVLNPSEGPQFPIVRTDPQINFDWGSGKPIVCSTSLPCVYPIGNNGFSVRWYGEVYIPQTGGYALGILTDDGGRLWVDDVLVIDNWYIPDTNQNWKYFPELAQGKHRIRFEYWEGEGNAKAQLLWSSVALGTHPIPSQFLTPLDFSPKTPNAALGDMVWVDAITGKIIDRMSTIIHE